MIENNKVQALALPDLIILRTEVFISIYISSPSIHILPRDSLIKTIHHKNFH